MKAKVVDNEIEAINKVKACYRSLVYNPLFSSFVVKLLLRLNQKDVTLPVISSANKLISAEINLTHYKI
jgi:hypothetical protein